MRWQHPREGLVRPDLFIPLAESSGLIVPMTRELMRQTAELLAPVADRLGGGFHVGINIAAAHCRSRELVEDCRNFLQAFEPGQVVLSLELTERELLEPDAFTDQLFADLHKLKVDYLKIDQSFVAMIGKDALSLHILDSVIDLCAKLQLEVIAEGVEDELQLRYLGNRRVDYLQGYLFGRPLPAAEFLACALDEPAASVQLPG